MRICHCPIPPSDSVSNVDDDDDDGMMMARVKKIKLILPMRFEMRLCDNLSGFVLRWQWQLNEWRGETGRVGSVGLTTLRLVKTLTFQVPILQ